MASIPGLKNNPPSLLMRGGRGSRQTFARRANDDRIPSLSAMKDSKDSSPACEGNLKPNFFFWTHLISKKNKSFILAEFNNFLLVFLSKNLYNSKIYDNKRSDSDTLRSSLLQLLFQLINLQSPPCLFIKESNPSKGTNRDRNFSIPNSLGRASSRESGCKKKDECSTLGLMVLIDTAGVPTDAVDMALAKAAAIAATGAGDRGCGAGAGDGPADLEAARRDAATARRALSAA
ncbi:hypothetical protein EJB05_11256, partial [Eragrostis curvula]